MSLHGYTPIQGTCKSHPTQAMSVSQSKQAKSLARSPPAARPSPEPRIRPARLRPARAAGPPVMDSCVFARFIPCLPAMCLAPAPCQLVTCPPIHP
jgi:hypothetical protein